MKAAPGVPRLSGAAGFICFAVFILDQGLLFMFSAMDRELGMFLSKLQGHLYVCLCPLGGTVTASAPAGEVPDLSILKMLSDPQIRLCYRE